MSEQKTKVRQTHFPTSLFITLFLVMLALAGVHNGLVVLISEVLCLSSGAMVVIVLLYWLMVAFGITLFIRIRIRKVYDEPMMRLAKATAQVAGGDFSVYVPPIHTENEYDYLDVMLLDFDKMVAELGSIETLKTDFFSNVSHEIKTPIAVIRNAAQLLQGEMMPDSMSRQYADTIVNASQKLSTLITNMLKLNKLEKQTIQSQPEEYDLCAQLCECALAFENRWEEKGIEFEADLEDSAPVTASTELMEIVWNNLLANAIKFTNSGGSVTLRERSNGDTVTVEVTDTGCGMTEDTMRHIFDKFYQGDTSHATEGNGLGLALALRVLQLHGGTISVRSKPGEGSSFLVTIPAANKEDNHE